MEAAHEPRTLILVSLAAEPRHGHSIMLDVEDFSGVRLGTGTLYGALQRLERDGLIEAVPTSDRRQPYRLTAAGAQALIGRVERYTAVVTVARHRLGAP